MLREIEFDSGLIAPRVGMVDVKDLSNAVALEPEIVSAARAANYDLVYLSLPERISMQRFQYIATIEEWDAPFEKVRDRVAPAKGRVASRSIEGSDWSSVPNLLNDVAPTRFTLDKRIAPEVGRQHKLKLLGAYAERPDAACVVAGPSGAELLGLHLGYPDGKDWRLYEIMIRPGARNGFTALTLIAEGLEKAALQEQAPQNLRTSIYSHNEQAKAFFEGLGFAPSDSVRHYYHLWLT